MENDSSEQTSSLTNISNFITSIIAPNTFADKASDLSTLKENEGKSGKEKRKRNNKC
jgi:hypothetical protein